MESMERDAETPADQHSGAVRFSQCRTLGRPNAEFIVGSLYANICEQFFC